MFEIRQGDVIEVLREYPSETFYAAFGDPPYGLEFMGKDWDKGVPGKRYWAEVLRVLKPGAVLMAFGGSRTHHRLMCAIEDAGFEIFDTMMWLYGSGFPKGHRLDRAVSLHLGEDAVCQCAANKHSNGNTSHEQPNADHTGKEALLHDDAHCQRDVLRCSNTMTDSPVDCRQGHHSDDAQPHAHLESAQGAFPLQEYAQEHTHSDALVDGLADESECSPSLVQHSDHPPKQDSCHQGHVRDDQSANIHENNKPVDTCESVHHIQDNYQGLSSSTSKLEYSSGLPCCQVCGKPIAETWTGYNVSLKPAWEPIVLARKPRVGTYAQTALEHGTAALNIDECRIGSDGGTTKGNPPKGKSLGIYGDGINGPCDIVQLNKGRWPANLILNEEAAAMLDEQSGVLKSGNINGIYNNTIMANRGPRDGKPIHLQFKGDSGGASRFFYCAKSSRAERDAGLEGMENETTKARNPHPTVKPLALCKYLAKLILPPEEYRDEAQILVPFAGSGSEMIGAMQAGWRNITGIEISEEYVEIAEKRLKYWASQPVQAELWGE